MNEHVAFGRQAMKGAQRHLAPLLLLLAVTFAVYWQTLGHDFVANWDDHYYVIDNEAVRGITPGHLKAAFSSFYVGNYAPVQIVSYMVDYSLWGLRAKGFLFTNILLHALNGVLFYLLCSRLLGSRLAAGAASLLFLCHPLQVESVAWVSQRKNLLAMFFFLGAFLLYIRYRERGGRLSYCLSLAALLLALLAKSVAVVFPLAILLYDLCFREDEGRRGVLANKLPYLLAVAAAGCLALVSQTQDAGGGRVPYHGGGPLATLLTMLPVFVRYLGLVFWPSGLSAVYSPPVKTGADAEVLLALLLLSLLAAAMVWLYRRQRQAFFWAALFAVGLLPVSQVVPIVTLMNDRYLYFPMLGVAGGGGFLVRLLLGAGGDGRRRLAAALLVLSVVVPLAYLSVRRAEVWSNPLTLWLDATAKTPGSHAAWYGLGEAYQDGGDLERAVAAQERARGLCEGCRGPLLKLSGLYLQQGEMGRSWALLQQLLKLHPRFDEGHLMLGNYYYQAGDLPGAERAYRQAITLNPRLAGAHANLGNVFLGEGKPLLAREQYLSAERTGRPTAQLAYGLACAESLLGNYEAAISYLENAVRMGYKNHGQLTSNPELAPLRRFPRFQRLVGELPLERSN